MGNEGTSGMKWTLRLEELVQLVAAVFLLADFQAAWYWYLVLAIGPDVGMLGYLAGPRTGAFTYNLLHHKGLSIAVAAAGVLLVVNPLLWLGLAMFGHAALDRMLGYGLKFPDSFQHTHLGWIGRQGPR